MSDDLQLRHELLRTTDRAIGAEAALDRLSAELAAPDDAVAGARQDLRDRLRAAEAQRDAALADLKRLRTSRTWRTGRAVLHPVGAVRGAVRRRRRGGAR